MLPVMQNASNEGSRRRRLGRRGKLVAISTIIFSASTAIGFADQYPVLAVATQSASIDRPCTQLELSAHMTSSECGTLTLSAVVARINALQSDDHDE